MQQVNASQYLCICIIFKSVQYFQAYSTTWRGMGGVVRDRDEISIFWCWGLNV